MNVLVVGGGGREHAIIDKLSQSPKVGRIYAAPGNAGIAELAECVPLAATDLKGIADFVDAHPDIGLTVVAPDDPLALGLVDLLEERGHRAFGPRKNAAIIESSKAFSKELMKKYGIPTAAFHTFGEAAEALDYVRTAPLPLVVKADGLALGKGVIIAQTREEAEQAVREVMCDKKFGAAGNRVVIEEFLTGREVSVLAFTDGRTVRPMVASQDHKRAFDHDEGLNTGGMGTFAPSRFYTPALAERCMKEVFQPTVAAMNAEGRPFKGVLYFGLMIDGEKVRVLEYNARFGDPETQVVLPLLKSDLLDIFQSCIDGTLEDQPVEWEEGACVCVILASGGYPVRYEKGKPITVGQLDEGIRLYHAGTKRTADGQLVTDGGRVLGVTAKGRDLEEARAKAYANVEKIHFDGMFFRHDIGFKL